MKKVFMLLVVCLIGASNLAAAGYTAKTDRFKQSYPSHVEPQVQAEHILQTYRTAVTGMKTLDAHSAVTIREICRDVLEAQKIGSKKGFKASRMNVGLRKRYPVKVARALWSLLAALSNRGRACQRVTSSGDWSQLKHAMRQLLEFERRNKYIYSHLTSQEKSRFDGFVVFWSK